MTDVTDFDIYLIARRALLREYEEKLKTCFPSDDYDLMYQRHIYLDHLEKQIAYVNGKIKEYDFGSESVSGSDDYHKR